MNKNEKEFQDLSARYGLIKGFEPPLNIRDYETHRTVVTLPAGMHGMLAALAQNNTVPVAEVIRLACTEYLLANKVAVDFCLAKQGKPPMSLV